MEALTTEMPDLAHVAAAHESALRYRAAEIRGEATELTPDLFLALWPLLLEPIPEAYIQRIPPVKGKPYESTGIRSVQVQVNRMNNVLTPLGWHDHVDYEMDGKLAKVTIVVVGVKSEPMFSRSSYGGVNQGSTTGNIYKGSYTNAAKRAFAMVGPGHEVYLGAADLDPDVNAEVADGPEKKPEPVGPQIAIQIVDRAWEVESVKSRLQLILVRLTGEDPGDVSTKAKAKAAVAKLDPADAQKLDEFIQEKR